MAEPRHPPEYRPFRVAMYALYFVFTIGFIGLIGWSVWSDLYLRERSPAREEQATIATCADDLEVLFRRLAARSQMGMTPVGEPDWNNFVREFEDRLANVQQRCVGVESRVSGDAAVRTAIADVSDKLDQLRLHFSRCGEEGEQERGIVAESIAKLRSAVRVSGH